MCNKDQAATPKTTSEISISLPKSMSNGSLCSAPDIPSTIDGAIVNATNGGSVQSRTRETSQQTKRNASTIAALMTILIFTWAVRSCITPDAKLSSRHKRTQVLRSARTVEVNYDLPAPYKSIDHGFF
mmetsp:Transcript_22098/g.47440  ORF Transcript_22098/g.47440 Transcript_22098/m.47440 type:complete len:128 (-) Transcript_22098:454-837(-)